MPDEREVEDGRKVLEALLRYSLRRPCRPRESSGGEGKAHGGWLPQSQPRKSLRSPCSCAFERLAPAAWVVFGPADSAPLRARRAESILQMTCGGRLLYMSNVCVMFFFRRPGVESRESLADSQPFVSLARSSAERRKTVSFLSRQETTRYRAMKLL